MDGWPCDDPWGRLSVEEANLALREGGYGLRVERSPGSGSSRLVGAPAGSGVPLGSAPTWRDLFAALARIGSPGQRRSAGPVEELTIGEVTSGAATSGAATGVGDHGSPGRPADEFGSALLREAFDHDPTLRTWCAVAPETGAATRFPAPVHPRHPSGTHAVELSALLRDAARSRAVLERLVGARPEQDEDELAWFRDFLIRPPLRVFRSLLDTHRIVPGRDARWCGVELSPERTATGRVVITAQRAPQRVAEADPADIRAGAAELVELVSMLADRFAEADFHGKRYETEVVRTEWRAVLAEELGELRPGTAALLDPVPALRGVARAISAEQDGVVRSVLHRVQEHTRARRWRPERPPAAVLIDVERCAMVPRHRIGEAIRAIAGPRPGAPDGVVEFADPERLALVPSLAESTWWNFLAGSGLADRYPEVDWQRVCAEFLAAIPRSGAKLRSDVLAPGLRRFVWDVRDAGGHVIFRTDRPERGRAGAVEVLARAGIAEPRVRCLPSAETGTLAEFAIVAVFDAAAAQRAAARVEFTDALVVAVEPPGPAGERRPGQPLVDEAPLIRTFERLSSPRDGRSGRLSHAHSLEEVRIGGLRENRQADEWAVELTGEQSLSIVDSIAEEADRRAQRAAHAARTRFGCDGSSPTRENTLAALHHLVTRKQFLKGSRSNYRIEHLRRDALPFVRAGAPIEVVLLGFPVKQCLNQLKAPGPLPDLAELGGLARLRELGEAVRAVYPPGLHFNILTDGRHFRPRSLRETAPYGEKLREYARLLGLTEHTTIDEVDAVVAGRLGADLPERRPALLAEHQARLAEQLTGFAITNDPLWTLERIAEHVPSAVAADPGSNLGLFRDLFMSMVFSVPVPPPAGIRQLAWSRSVFDDLYNLADDTASAAVRHARARVLRDTWDTVVRYLATLRVDDDLGYERLFPDRIRLTVSAVRTGRAGFTYLGGSGLLPWQGTGAVDARGNVGADFAVSLRDRGFLPVRSPLLGTDQPWLMAPAEVVRTRADGSPALDPEFARRIRLRRG